MKEATGQEPLTFTQGFNSLGIRHFRAEEFLYLGASHHAPKSAGYGLNEPPPKELWENIYQLAKVLDEIRERLGAPLRIISCYRSEAYNAAIGGARYSKHKQGIAGDIQSSRVSASQVYKVAKKLRDEGVFEGGIGRYSTFTHVDNRGKRADWDNRY